MKFEHYTIEEFVCDQSFQNFCRGCNYDDVDFWVNWIDENPHRRDEIQEAIQIFDQLSIKQRYLHRDFKDLESAIQHRLDLAGRLGLDASVEPKPRYKRNGLGGLKRFRAAALVMFLIVGLGVISQYYHGLERQKAEIVYTTLLSDSQAEPIERKTVFLPDSSVVVLSKNSEITIAPDFSRTNRKASISGEAYFDITHDPAHPFYLDCSDIGIRVLGTQFTVKNYPDSDSVQTTLIRGQIEVSYADEHQHIQKVLLQPNQHLILQKPVMEGGFESVLRENRVVTLLNREDVLEVSGSTEWVRKRLSFENDDLATIAEELEAWYGVQIEIENEEVKNYRYTGSFEDENIRLILEVLQESYPFGVETEGNTIRIYE